MGHEIDREAIGPEPDIGTGPHAMDDRAHDLATGLVAEGVHDPGVRVPAFESQRHMAVDLIEVGAPLDQLTDPDRCLADDHLDDLGIAEPLAGSQGVGDVVVEAIFGVEDPGDPALGVLAVALADLVLGHDEDAISVGDPEHDRKPAIPPPMTRTSVK